MTDPFTIPDIKPCFYCNHEDPKTIYVINEYRGLKPVIWIECCICDYKSSVQFNTPKELIEAHNFIAEAIEEKIKRRMDRNDK